MSLLVFVFLMVDDYFDLSGDVLIFKASPSQPVIILLLNEIFPSLQLIVKSHSQATAFSRAPD